MFRSIRWRITIPYAVLISLSILALGGFLTIRGRTFLVDNLTADLLARAHLLAGLLQEESLGPANADSLDATLHRLAEDQSLRITLIALDGTVIGETEEDRTQMENHADRPEVMDALADGEGIRERFSATLRSEHLYAAVPVVVDGAPAAVLRLAIPLDQVEASVASLRTAVMAAALIAAILGVLLADLIARRTVRPLRELTEVSRKIIDGETIAQPFPIAADEVGDLARALNQMSEQLQSQIEALQAEREKFSTVLQQMDSGVVMVDPEGRIALVNRAAEGIFGIREEDSIGATLVEKLRLYQIVETWEHSRDTNATESRALDLLNQERSLQLVATPLGGLLQGNTLLIFQDVTRMRQLETIRRDFVSNISHELRTPLASLKALTDTLLDGALDDPPAARRFLTLFETELDSLSLLVQELFELTRIESGRVPLEFERIAPEDHVRSAVDRLYLQAERAGLKIDVEVSPDLPFVQADPPRMQQVLMNLLHNAIKFTPAGGSITMRAEPGENGSVRFAVQDTGVGIPADDVPRIFERFYKSDRARSSGGTGLGLAISKHLVEAHGGHIWAESVQREGSTFYFELQPAA